MPSLITAYILLTPYINYLHMFHSVPIYDSLRTLPIYYILFPYRLPVNSLNTLHILPTNWTSSTYSCTNTAHVGLLLLGTPLPRPQGGGGNHLAGGVWWSLLMCIYIYTHTSHHITSHHMTWHHMTWHDMTWHNICDI